jgi:hypothetical protein
MVGDGKLFATQEIKDYLQFTILQSVGVNGSYQYLEELEDQWRNKLQSWSPLGLNVREDGPVRMRTK